MPALPFGVIEIHSPLHFVVSSHSEGDDFHRGQAWCHAEDLPSLCRLVEVLLGLRVRHACRITPYNVEVGPSNHASPAVPLYL